VRDLPWSEFKTAVHIEVYRVKCPDCGVKVEKVPLLPSKAPFSKRFEDAVGQACESAAARQVARRFGLTETTVRAIDLRYLERWAAARREPPLRHMGVDELNPDEIIKAAPAIAKLAGPLAAAVPFTAIVKRMLGPAADELLWYLRRSISARSDGGDSRVERQNKR
jgi:hypothetical protein